MSNYQFMITAPAEKEQFTMNSALRGEASALARERHANFNNVPDKFAAQQSCDDIVLSASTIEVCPKSPDRSHAPARQHKPRPSSETQFLKHTLSHLSAEQGVATDFFLAPLMHMNTAAFGPLVETCAKFGIKRGMAFRLAREKRIATFRISSKRFVVISSIEALAEVSDHE